MCMEDRRWPHNGRFLLIAQRQCQQLKCEDPACPNVLKSIDEYNYCKHTSGQATSATPKGSSGIDCRRGRGHLLNSFRSKYR
jgi:hypothetical protein